MRKPGQVTYKDRIKTVRECSKCKKNETEVDFYLRYRTVCKKCHNRQSKDRYAKNRKKMGGYW
jgi:recombinational DNA repair protein (RecF pathway)